MFAFIVKRFMKSRRFGKVMKFLSSNMALEDVSYSQNCEDIIISHLLGDTGKGGIYVDVGAHDPIRFSNTLQLYYDGWNGINIDPLPNCMKRFREYRPKDINLNVGISSAEGMMSYYEFREPAYNTLSTERAEHIIKSRKSELIKKEDIRVVTLKRVFDKYIGSKTIDVLTIDVETMEYDVLVSNDWAKYKPRLIVMESIMSLDSDLRDIRKDRAIDLLYENGYAVAAKVQNAVFLVRASAAENK